jgi:hypothetical protein
MVMHRIHQLATDWGVTSKEIIDRLERMGIKGKRAQSGLSDADAERVRGEMGLGGGAAEPVVVRRTVEVRDAVGEAVTAVDTITETHVKRGVLVRRTQRTALERAGERAVPILKTPALRVATSVALAPDVLATLDRNEFAYASTPVVFLARSEPAVALPEPPMVAEPMLAPVTTPTPLVEERESVAIDDAADVVPVAAISDETPVVEADAVADEQLVEEIPVQADSEEEDLTPVDEPDKLAEELLSHAKRAEQDKAQKEAPGFGRQGSVRVLGKIDLSRKAAAPAPVEKPAAPAAPAADDKPGRKKKRKVVRKEDLFDDFERAM